MPSLGYCYLNLGQHELAIDQHTEETTASMELLAMGGQASTKHARKRRVGTGLLNVRKCYFFTSNTERALELFEEAKKIFEEEEIFGQEMATVCGDLGNCHQRMGNYELAFELFAKQLAPTHHCVAGRQLATACPGEAGTRCAGGQSPADSAGLSQTAVCGGGGAGGGRHPEASED